MEKVEYIMLFFIFSNVKYHFLYNMFTCSNITFSNIYFIQNNQYFPVFHYFDYNK